jgi:plasmid stabilization system protein ParE
MNDYKVIITERALRDLQEIASYIRESSPQNAELVADRVVAAIDSLKTMPQRFKCVVTSRKRKLPIHAVVVAPFIIYYSIGDAVVHVLTVVRAAKRQPRHFT